MTATALRRAAFSRAVLLVVLALAAPAAAEERYALIVAGATGGPAYAQQYSTWTQAFSQALIDQLRFDASRVVLLGEGPDEARAATAPNLRRVFATIRQQLRA